MSSSCVELPNARPEADAVHHVAVTPFETTLCVPPLLCMTGHELTTVMMTATSQRVHPRSDSEVLAEDQGARVAGTSHSNLPRMSRAYHCPFTRDMELTR